MGFEQTEESKKTSSESTQAVEPRTPAVVAHFHLSSMFRESAVVDPFNLAAGRIMSLKTLDNRIEQASSDREVKGVILILIGYILDLGNWRRSVSFLARKTFLPLCWNNFQGKAKGLLILQCRIQQ